MIGQAGSLKLEDGLDQYWLVLALKKIVKKHLQYFGRLYNVYLDDSDCLCAAIEFLSGIISSGVLPDNVERLVRNFCRNYARRLCETRSVNSAFVPELSMVEKPEFKLILEDTIDSFTKGLPESFRILILYFLFRQDSLKPFLKNSKKNVLKYAIQYRIMEILRSMQSGEAEDITDFLLSNKEHLAILLNRYPQLLYIVFLTKNLSSAVDFVLAFGDQEIKIPSIADLKLALEDSSRLKDSIHNNSLSIRDRVIMKAMSKDTETIKMFGSVLRILESAYSEAFASILSKIEEKDLSEAVEILSKLGRELDGQIRLMKEISTSGKDLDKLISELSAISER